MSRDSTACMHAIYPRITQQDTREVRVAPKPIAGRWYQRQTTFANIRCRRSLAAILATSRRRRTTSGWSAATCPALCERVAVRQWIVSVPKRLRWFLGRADQPKAVAALTRIFMSEVERLVREAAGVASTQATADTPLPRIGGVSFLHRFGSPLNRHVHLHVCVTDGVFAPNHPLRPLVTALTKKSVGPATCKLGPAGPLGQPAGGAATETQQRSHDTSRESVGEAARTDRRAVLRENAKIGPQEGVFTRFRTARSPPIASQHRLESDQIRSEIE